MFSPNLVSHPQRHVTFFRLPGIGWVVGTWWVGRESRGAIVGNRRGSKSASEKNISSAPTHMFNCDFK